MADLIGKFFQEDLSEAEEKALGEELISSEETALRLGEKAEQAYTRLGLPEPIWPDSAGTVPYVTKTIPWNWVWFWALSAGMVGVTAWWCFFHKSHAPAPSASLTGPASIEMPRIISHEKHSKTTSMESLPSVKRPLTKTSVSAVAKEKPIQAASAVSVFPSPLNLDESPSQSYSNLSVVVRRSTPGFLTVRVLNALDAEVVLLYRGDLAAGNWVFEWNGRLVDGRMAVTGDYQIEVQSGSYHQRKTVQINQN
jgi:hypothetical protein